jgi:hypothetical protein
MKTNSPTTITLETFTPRIIALTLLALILLLALTGCESRSRDAEKSNPAGVYSLISVDGQSVPCKLTHEGTTMTVKSGAFTISTNGSCSSQITFSVPPRGDMSRVVNATYTSRGAELTMRWEGAGVTTGNIRGNTFTMNNEGMVFSYQK